MEIEVLAIEINVEPIELCKLLKIANLVGGGGEAKMVISEGYVYLNGEVEFQKRKKVYAEDIVQFNGEAIMPILADTVLPEDSLVDNGDTEEFFAQPFAEQPYADEVNTETHEQAMVSYEPEQPVYPERKAKQAQKPAKQGKNKPKGKAGSKGTNNKGSNKSSNKNTVKKDNTPNSRTGRKSISF